MAFNVGQAMLDATGLMGQIVHVGCTRQPGTAYLGYQSCLTGASESEWRATNR